MCRNRPRALVRDPAPPRGLASGSGPSLPITAPQRLLPAPPNGVSPASHTQVGGWTVDPVCLLSSLCSHLHGDSAPSGAGQPAQVSHPPPPQPQTLVGVWLWGGLFFGGGIPRTFILHPIFIPLVA